MTIGAYPLTGAVGEFYRVPLVLTSGRATLLQVWMNDGAQPVNMVSQYGVEFRALDVFLRPQRPGTFRLYAAAEDACGNRNQTGLVRTVVIQ